MAIKSDEAGWILISKQAPSWARFKVNYVLDLDMLVYYSL